MLKRLKGYRFPWIIIEHCIYPYHRFCLSYRDIEEIMFARGVRLTYESIRNWCLKLGRKFTDVLKKKQAKRTDKWHLDEMVTKINGEKYILWRAVDSEGYELDILIQKRKNKKAAVRFLKRILGSNPQPRVIVTDKLNSYIKPIKSLCPPRRREKSMIKMKSVSNAQNMLSLMGVMRNYFSVDIGRYKNSARVRREYLKLALSTWQNAAIQVSCA